MNDGEIIIDTGIDTSGIDKGAKNLNTKLQKVTKDAKSSTSSIAALGMAASGIGMAFQAAQAIVGKFSAAINECTDLYKTQVKAETQLEAAARNNPYLNRESVQNLKDFASELQGIGTIGDESLMPLMAQLAASGRNQQEIQDIMKVSLDMAASGTMSMESAVQSLNKTYSGSAGLLKKEHAELSSLTDEELKNGKAVEVLGKKYQGMAAETTKAVGSSIQLSNSIGDLKEIIGKNFAEMNKPVERFFTKLIDNINSALGKINKLRDDSAFLRDYEKYESANLTSEQNRRASDIYKVEIEEAEKSIAATKKEYDDLNKKAQNWLNKRKKTYQELSDLDKEYYNQTFNFTLLNEKLIKQEEELEAIRDKQSTADNIARQQEKEEADKRTAAQRAAAEKEISNARLKARKEYDDTIEKLKAEIKYRRSVGEEITKQQEAEMLAAAATEAYIKKMQTGLFTGNYEIEVNNQKQIKEWLEIAKDVGDFDAQGTLDNILSSYGDEVVKGLNATLDYLETLYQDGLIKYDDYIDKQKELTKSLADAEKEIAQKRIENVQNMLTTINEAASQVYDTINGFSQIAITNAQNEATQKTAALEKEYANGLKSYDEYQDEKKKIDKESQREQYKAQMWAWSAQLLQIEASTAVAVMNAYSTASNATIGAIMASLVSAAGAAQLAAAIAAKPIPAFAHGGIVGGSSYYGDKIQANVNSGEMVLTQAQQKQLWRVANGAGVQGNNVVVKNYMGDSAQVSTNFDNGQLSIMINRIVKSGMEAGEYSNSLAAAQNLQNGITYQS